MSKVICTVCGREIDSRGLSGHMRTHKGKKDDTDGVILYPSNERITNDVMTVPEQGVKKPVKKTIASKPASSPSSKPGSSPDTRGQHNSGAKRAGHPVKQGVTETEQAEDYHKAREWKGFFRD